MAQRIGPTGQHPFGAPVVPGDRGGIRVGFRVLMQPVVHEGKSYRVCELAFGTNAGFLMLEPDQARATIVAMRKRIREVFGNVPYDKTKLERETGIRVNIVSGKRLLEIKLPHITSGIVANPHVFLSLCDHIEDRLGELGD